MYPGNAKEKHERLYWCLIDVRTERMTRDSEDHLTITDVSGNNESIAILNTYAPNNTYKII